MSDEKPAIMYAAYRTPRGDIYTGMTHCVIWCNMPRQDKDDAEEGFMTNAGVFVNRREAAVIAFECGQTATNVGVLYSKHLSHN